MNNKDYGYHFDLDFNDKKILSKWVEFKEEYELLFDKKDMEEICSCLKKHNWHHGFAGYDKEIEEEFTKGHKKLYFYVSKET